MFVFIILFFIYVINVRRKKFFEKHTRNCNKYCLNIDWSLSALSTRTSFLKIIFLIDHWYVQFLIGNICSLPQKYIHNRLLKPFSHDGGIASHSIQVVCVNFVREWQDLQFNVDSEPQNFWENFSLEFYLHLESLPESC